MNYERTMHALYKEKYLSEKEKFNESTKERLNADGERRNMEIRLNRSRIEEENLRKSFTELTDNYNKLRSL